MELTLSCILEQVYYITNRRYEIMQTMDNWKRAAEILKNGGVAVLPTDTIYGIHCMATNKEAVERVYKIKGRDFNKPFIILIPNKGSLEDFGVVVDNILSKLLDDYWPGPNSIIFSVTDRSIEYLHRGTKTLAFRVPNYQPLLNLLKQTGPLISTSANTSGKAGAKDIGAAKVYFDDLVDYYLDAGKLDNQASNVYKIIDGVFTKLR